MNCTMNFTRNIRGGSRFPRRRIHGLDRNKYASHRQPFDAEITQLSEDISIDEVAQTIRESLPKD
jgi:hypothetical protein